MPKDGSSKSVKFRAGARGGPVCRDCRNQSQRSPITAGDLEVDSDVRSEACVGRKRCESQTHALRSQKTRLGSMPNFLIREISVVRLIAIRTAAPSAPPTRPIA